MSETSWGKVASWYDEYLSDSDTYQTKVIWPNLKRILASHKGLQVLDIACGQGFFSKKIAECGASVTGTDISKELISLAKENVHGLPEDLLFQESPAHKQMSIKDASIDLVTCVLALQNIKELDETMQEVSRVLKPGGRFVFVLNHPAFRVPQHSDWYFDQSLKKQGRVVYKYLLEQSIKIDMNPGSKGGLPKKFTYSFQRPLQLFFKLLSKQGFMVSRLEEWASHKKTEAGPRKEAEDMARMEIPMFLCIEAVKSVL